MPGYVEIQSPFLEVLEDLREALSMSQRQLAETLGINSKTFNRWHAQIKKSGIQRIAANTVVTICQNANCYPERLGLPDKTAKQVRLLLEEISWIPSSDRICLFDEILPTNSDPGDNVFIVPLQCFRYRFVEMGTTAASFYRHSDELWLDVGNRLGDGVIDHHQKSGDANSSTRLVYDHPEFIQNAVRPGRNSTDPFTIVLQSNTDLDCLAALYLTKNYLTTGRFHESKRVIESFISFVDRVDQGFLTMTHKDKYSLYSAFYRMTGRLRHEHKNDPDTARLAAISSSSKLFDFVLANLANSDRSLLEIDAFNCPGMYDDEDRAFVRKDHLRYEKSLSRKECHARQGMLKLPLRYGGRKSVDTLLIRNVTSNNPEPSRYFKIWARSDLNRASEFDGFVVLCTYDTQSDGRSRCIISIKPEVCYKYDVTLNGLGAMLEVAESKKRHELYGADDRLTGKNGKMLTPRPGYSNYDPWYDGRAHNDTIVDTPRTGTCLSADEVEDILFDFGNGIARNFEFLY
ncbi:hypothetical protein Enr17x_36210 [Gimesia fumaroli]|uniref:HTH cro/C1-type domain-containing protein n=2 Tax=Gimesia fumaroli TaxID=2527976 RepID=A0A518IEQ5_9PLAN|nr:hypothetical protein Enr17x_36210 [Gimesia fumaroli]